MIRCENCGGEVAEGRDLCPHCGKAVGGGGRIVKAPEARADAPAAVPSFGVRREEKDKSRMVIYAAVAVVALLLVAGLAYLASRPSAKPGEERLAGAIRPGAAEYPGDKLILDFEPDEDATIGGNALGQYVVMMKPTVRNFTGA